MIQAGVGSQESIKDWVIWKSRHGWLRSGWLEGDMEQEMMNRDKWWTTTWSSKQTEWGNSLYLKLWNCSWIEDHVKYASFLEIWVKIQLNVIYSTVAIGVDRGHDAKIRPINTRQSTHTLNTRTHRLRQRHCRGETQGQSWTDWQVTPEPGLEHSNYTGGRDKRRGMNTKRAKFK